MAKKKIRNSSKFKVGSTLLLTIAPDASGFAASGFSFVSSSSSPENIFAYLKAALHLNGDIFSLFIIFLQPHSGIKVKELLVVQLTHRGRPLHQVWYPKSLGVIKIEQWPHLPKHHHYHDMTSWHIPDLRSSSALSPSSQGRHSHSAPHWTWTNHKIYIFSPYKIYFFYDLVIGGGHLVGAQVNSDLTSVKIMTVTGKQKKCINFHSPWP